MRKIVPLLTCLSLSACSPPPNIATTVAYSLPSQLNSRQQEFDGRYVVVRGIAILGFEKRYLVQNLDDAKHLSSINNCLTLYDPAGFLARNESAYNMRVVEIKGVFKKRLPANIVMLGACSETILEVDETNLPHIIK